MPGNLPGMADDLTLLQRALDRAARRAGTIAPTPDTGPVSYEGPLLGELTEWVPGELLVVGPDGRIRNEDPSVVSGSSSLPAGGPGVLTRAEAGGPASWQELTGGGGSVGGIEDVPGLQAALDALQEEATAATDTELSAAVATINTALAAKQEGATAATDAELSAAVATINTSLAAKQDTASAATQAELDAAVATINDAVTAKAAATDLAAALVRITDLEADLAAAVADRNVELDYAEITANYNVPSAAGGATVYDVPGLEVTFTVTDRPVTVEAWAQGMMSGTANSAMQLRIYEGTTILAIAPVYETVANQSLAQPNPKRRLALAPGEHTLKVALYGPAGHNITLLANASMPAALQVVEV